MKNVLITGGCSGLGKELSFSFKKNGYNVIATYCNSKDVSLLKDNGIDTYKCDLSDEDSINNLFSYVRDNYGFVDLLINNAAYEEDSEVSFKTKESFVKTFDINVFGPFLLTRLIGDLMYENKKGKIIFISSNNSLGKEDPVTMEYDASKSAINSLVINFAKHYAPYVIVNAIAPGWILTDRIVKQNSDLDGMLEKEESKKILLNRFASTEDIANLLLFMASDKCNYIDGEIIRIDGGSLC